MNRWGANPTSANGKNIIQTKNVGSGKWGVARLGNWRGGGGLWIEKKILQLRKGGLILNEVQILHPSSGLFFL